MHMTDASYYQTQQCSISITFSRQDSYYCT